MILGAVMDSGKVKVRAGRNKTVTVKEDELPELCKFITGAADITPSFDFCDKIINADLQSIIDYIPDGPTL